MLCPETWPGSVCQVFSPAGQQRTRSPEHCPPLRGYKAVGRFVDRLRLNVVVRAKIKLRVDHPENITVQPDIEKASGYERKRLQFSAVNEYSHAFRSTKVSLMNLI